MVRHVTTFSTSLYPEQKEKITRLANAVGMTRSEFVVFLLENLSKEKIAELIEANKKANMKILEIES